MLLPGARNVAEAKLGDRSFSASVCRSSSDAAPAQQEAPKLPFELLLKFPRYRSEGKKMSRLHKVDVTGTVFPCALVRAYVSFRPGEDSPPPRCPRCPRVGRGQIGGSPAFGEPVAIPVFPSEQLSESVCHLTDKASPVSSLSDSWERQSGC